MSLDNNNIIKDIVYIPDTLVYNIPLSITTNDDGSVKEQVLIATYKNTDDNLPLLVSNLTVNVDYTVEAITTGSNNEPGVLVTFINNLDSIDFFRIERYTEPSFVNNYSDASQSVNIKKNLQEDLPYKTANVLQEQEKEIALLENNQNILIKQSTEERVKSFNNRTGNVLPLNGDYTASQVDFTPNSIITSTNTQDAIVEASELISEAVKGNVKREACRVASNVNIDLLNVTVIDGITLIIGNRVLIKSQTNKAENGIYVYSSANTLARASDNDTLAKIAGSLTQVTEGTFTGVEFNCIVKDTAGTLGTEAIIVEITSSNVADNQITTEKLAKITPKSVLGNNTDNIANVNVIFYDDLKIGLNINNVDNTSDTLKPISQATQNALDLKANQSDLDSLNTFVVVSLNDFLTAIGNKQDILPNGNEGQFLKFVNGQYVPSFANKADVELENVPNIPPLEYPISNAQRLVNDQTITRREGFATTQITDLNNTTNLKTGLYFIQEDYTENLLNLPTGFKKRVTTTQGQNTTIEKGSNADLKIINSNIEVQQFSQIQFLYEQYAENTLTINNIYYRFYDRFNLIWTEWRQNASDLDIERLDGRIDTLVLEGLNGQVYTIAQIDNLLSQKQDKLSAGTSDELRRGDNSTIARSTDSIPEGNNSLYFTPERATNSSLGIITPNRDENLQNNDTVKQGIEKKLDAKEFDEYKETVYNKTESDERYNRGFGVDVSAGIDLTPNVNFIAPSNGYVDIILDSNPNSTNNPKTNLGLFIVDGVRRGEWKIRDNDLSENKAYTLCSSYAVAKGQVCQYFELDFNNSVFTVNTLKFYPVKI